MKKILFIVFAVSFAFVLNAQPKNPVNWKFESKKKSDGVYELIATATFEKPWHIYSQNTPKGGPVPTKFTFKPNPLVELDGKAKEIGKLEKINDQTFKVEVLYYSNNVQFVQTVKLKAKATTSVSGTVEYMVCNDEECLPPVKKAFEIKLQ